MKGSWVTTFAVGGVLLLLTLFLGLQFNWLAQASDAERERMQRRVDADTKAFADDFNREIQAAYFNFQMDAATWEKADYTEFNERYEYWKSKTQYPELISEFVFFGKEPAQPLKYDPVAKTFSAADVPADLASLRAKIESSGPFKNFYEEAYALVMPVHEPEKHLERIILRRSQPGQEAVVRVPAQHGFLLIALNRSVVSDRLLPDLIAKHFPEGNFRVAVRNKEQTAVYEPTGEIVGPDAKAGLLNLSPDSMIFFGERAMFSKVNAERRQGVLITESVESKTFTHSQTLPDGAKTGTFTFELQPKVPGAPANVKTRTSVLAAAGQGLDPWVLNVQHATGSIDTFTRNEFRQSFLIGLGVYLLLVGAIIAIVLSALRSKRFAQRQIDFVSSVSHEFRTPLAVIYSASENLADGVTKDVVQVSRYGNLIKGEGRKLSAMVEQILQFAGARSGKKKHSFSPTSVAAVVDAAISECRPMLDERGFDIKFSVDENLPLIKADADALSTALQNLISNSVKYSNGSRSLCITASNGNRRIKLTVEDNGLGIAPDDLKHIFEPFYRAKDVVDAQINGNGLGLALVKDIAEAHGGTVRAKSEVGKGSEFTIELPQK